MLCVELIIRSTRIMIKMKFVNPCNRVSEVTVNYFCISRSSEKSLQYIYILQSQTNNRIKVAIAKSNTYPATRTKHYACTGEIEESPKTFRAMCCVCVKI